MIPVRLPGTDSSKKRRNKFGNQPTKGWRGFTGAAGVDDNRFDSRHERRVFTNLQMSLYLPEPERRAVRIRRQVPYVLLPPQYVGGKLKERKVEYVADFVVEYADGRSEVIDAKSEITRKQAAYILKRKLMLFVHQIVVIER